MSAPYDSGTGTLDEAFLIEFVIRVLRGKHTKLKGLILAQNERWRRGLGMQVEREAFLREGGQRRKGE